MGNSLTLLILFGRIQDEIQESSYDYSEHACFGKALRFDKGVHFRFSVTLPFNFMEAISM